MYILIHYCLKILKIIEYLQMGDAVSAVAPDYRISWSLTNVNRLDTTKLKTEKPDIYESYLKRSSSRRFQVKYEPAA